ncbi:MAG: hypothetical protein WCT39_00105 [Candidatus Margulisiibacteriota bacterium]
MGTYKAYINQLKEEGTVFDAGKMHARIEAGITRRSRRTKLAMEGMLAGMLVGLVFYYNFYLYIPNSREAMAEYVFQQENIKDDSVMNYVFMD